MKIIIEPNDFVEALTPFYNGCSYIAYIEEDDVFIGFGCYCLVNLQTGAKAIFRDKIYNNKIAKRFSIKELCETNSDYYKAREAILKMKDCKCSHCDGTVLFKRMT